MITRAYFVYIVGHIQAGHVKGSTPVTSEIFQFRGLESLVSFDYVCTRSTLLLGH